jgi:adenine phosphoribosyltransferase
VQQRAPFPIPSERELKEKLRVVPGFPKKGVNFIDITTLVKDPVAFRSVVDVFSAYLSKIGIDVVVGIEARGFIIGSAVAYKMGVGFVPARKKGKLPFETMSAGYTLEYGTEYIEMHTDGVSKGQKVGIVDDLLATGGTAEATLHLVEKLGGKVVALAFLVELDFLHGRDKLNGYEMKSLVHYDE